MLIIKKLPVLKSRYQLWQKYWLLLVSYGKALIDSRDVGTINSGCFFLG